MSFHHTKSHYRKLRLCLEFQALPRAFYRALGTSVLTALHPLPRVGPSAGRDPRHNHVFAESQPSARCAPSEKERERSHLGCRPLCRRLRREAVGTDATCAESPLQGSRQRRWPLFNPVDWALPRASWGRRQRTRLCRRPTLGTGPLSRAQPGSRQRSNFF
jgi:hypothetical protein